MIKYTQGPSKCPACRISKKFVNCCEEGNLHWIECTNCHTSTKKYPYQKYATLEWRNDKRRYDPDYDTFVYACIDNKDNIVATGSTVRELAVCLGVKEKSINETMSRAKRLGTKCKYIKIFFEEEE